MHFGTGLGLEIGCCIPCFNKFRDQGNIEFNGEIIEFNEYREDEEKNLPEDTICEICEKTLSNKEPKKAKRIWKLEPSEED